MNTYGYCRVSTDDQAINGQSLDAQRAQITGYAMMQGWAAPEIFIEAGVSGSIPFAERPQGKTLLAKLERGDAIVTPKLDRAFRSASDALGTLEELKDQGISLHMIDLGGDVTGNGISKLVFTILAAVAENERSRIRERIRDVKRHMTAQGLHAGGKRPIGWDIVEGRLVPNPAEQAMIEEWRALRRQPKPVGYHTIGKRFGMPATSIKRILDRLSVAA